MKNQIEVKFQSFLEKQNAVRKCGCSEVMRNKDYKHHVFFCPTGGEGKLTDHDVTSLVISEQAPQSLAA